MGDQAQTVLQSPRAIGARVPRKEDRRLLTGRATYVDDVSLPRMTHACFVRSTQSHAKLIEVATAAARVPGVTEVLTAADLEGRAKPIRALNSTPGYQECDTPILAAGKVRMVGEPIALVIADSRYAAEDGAAAVEVTYEPLRPLVEIDDAIAPDAPAIHDEIPDNLFNRFEADSGDVEGAFAEADQVVELELRQQRYGAAPMEGRAVVAEPAGSSGLNVWLSSQVPHIARTGLAKFLSLPESTLRVIAPDVGGGFGSKCVLYQEEVAVCAAALMLDRPVKWVGDRTEDLLTTVHGREQIHRVRGALTADGRVLAVDVEILSSNGAYAPWPFTAGLDSGQASENVTGPYDVRAYRRRVSAVVTNKCPMGPYRGVGRVIACLTMERLMDEAATRLGLDRLEIRRRNLVSEFPYETATGLILESGDYQRSLDMLAEAIGWGEDRPRERHPRRGERLRGVGVACAVEHSAYGPRSLGSRNHELTLGYDTASLRVEPDGNLRLAVGLHSHGQGHETTMAQIVADELGVDPGEVEVVYGDTAVVPYGAGTWASRSTVYCGGAAVLAARDIRGKAIGLAADMLEASPDDLQLADGAISVRGTPGRSLSLREVARRATHEPHLLPAGLEPGLESTRRYSAPDPGSFSSAMHAAEVELDPETGEVRVLRYAVVEDCGTVINPTIVEGQVHGGVAQGIGGALSEHLAYDEAGQLVSASFMDYLLPTAAEIPAIEVLHVESPSPHTIGGWKGMGEGGSINAPAAIVSAVNDALSGLGVTANHTPLDPAWIRGAIARAAAGA